MRYLSLFCLLVSFSLSAQDRMIDADSVIETEHQLSINGQSVSYQALLWDTAGVE